MCVLEAAVSKAQAAQDPAILISPEQNTWSVRLALRSPHARTGSASCSVLASRWCVFLS